MESRTEARAFAFLIPPLLCGFAILVLSTPSGLGQSLVGPTTRSPEGLLKEAEELHQAGKFTQAIEYYRLFLQKFPDVTPVRSDLGAALAGAGRYEEAIAEYQRVLRLKSIPQVRANLALAYYKTAQLPLAVAELRRVHEDLPHDFRPVMLLADCYLRLGDNKKVIGLLDPLRATKEDRLAAIYLLGTALLRDGQVAKGQAIIDPILKNGDSAEARLLLGTTKLMVNDFPGALVDLQKAVELNPKLPDVYAYYGVALISTGDQTGAQQAFERALQVDPNNFESHLRLGVLLRQDEKYEAALQHLRHALEMRPGDVGVRYQIASIELAQGEVGQARAHLESLVAEAPNFTEAHVSLATVYYREKKKAEGDNERAIVGKLNAERQATEKGAQVAP